MSELAPTERSTLPDRGLLVAGGAAFAGFTTILVVVVLCGGSDTFDLSVASRAPLLRSATTSRLAAVITSLGTTPVLVTVTLLAIARLCVHNRRLWTSAILASSVATTAGLVVLLKSAVGRPRPSVSNLIGSPARDLSFPSGHATNATLVYVLVTLLLTDELRRPAWRRIATASAVALALLIGLSRIYLGYHWGTDVLAGWLLAAGVTALSYFTSRRLEVAGSVAGWVDLVTPTPDHRSRPDHLV